MSIDKTLTGGFAPRLIVNEDPPLVPYADVSIHTPSHARRVTEHGEPTPYVRSKQRPARAIPLDWTRAVPRPITPPPEPDPEATAALLAGFVVCALVALFLFLTK